MRAIVILAGKRGFSLVELMAVLGIMSILAMMAVPEYSKYAAMSKMSEAKTNLASLYACEQTYHGFWSTYFGDFRNLGLRPGGVLLYNFGFSGAGPANAASYTGGSPNVGPSAGAVQYSARLYCPSATDPTCSLASGAGSLTATVLQQDQFTAQAVGDIDGDSYQDTWTLDQAKVLSHTKDDVSNSP